MHWTLRVSASFGWLLAMLGAGAGAQAQPRVVINELLASNAAGLADENGDTSDWIELLNAGNAPADLSGWGLSDNWQQPFKWRFQSGQLAPGEFLIVFASGKDRQPESVAPRDPSTIAGLALWLTAEGIATNNLNLVRRFGANVYVKQWPDRSGQSNHASAANDAAQPIWIPAAANGFPVLRFDGSSDLLQLARIPATNSFCLIAVARPTRSHEIDPAGPAGVGGVAGQRYLFGAQHGGDANGGSGVSMGTNGVSIYEHGSSYMPALAAYAGPLGGKMNVVTVNYSGKHPALYVHGLLAMEGFSSPRAQVTAPVEIGAGSYGAFAGDIAEILLFRRALDESERRGVEQYLAGRYGLNHPLPRHANFQISADGEELLLTRPDGFPGDYVEFGPQLRDVSFGRPLDGSANLQYFGTPTPGASNSTPGTSEFLLAPEFSAPGGFYSESFDLTVNARDPAATIRYTLDGAEPTEESAMYSAPISIRPRAGTANVVSAIPTVPGGPTPSGEVFKGWVVRARAFKAGALPSAIITRTFWVDPRGRGRYSVPVVSLATDRRNFFSAETGIYVPGNNVNYNRRGPEWERPVHIELCETDNSVPVSQPGDAKIHGNTSQNFPIKGLDLDSTGAHGRAPFRYRFFPDRDRAEFEHILLRPTGHDQQMAFMRDEMMQSLGTETGAESQAARLCVVFINGEYWGLHYLKEKEDAEFVGYYAGLPEEELDYLEGYAAAKAGDTGHYDELIRFVANHDLSAAANYAGVLDRMEVPNYIDYKACEIFFYRWDIGNHRLWRPRTPEGRWRWLQFDNDVGWGGFWAEQPAWQFNMLAAVLTPNGSLHDHNNETTTFLLRRLVTSAEFNRAFVNRFADLLNTIFLTQRTRGRIDQFSRLLEPEMAEHIRRWRAPGSLTEWRSHLQALHTYASNRPAAVRQHLQTRFGLGTSVILRLGVDRPSAGAVQLNSLTITNAAETPFMGDYFRNHPVTLRALPNPGFRFAGWEGLPAADSAEATLIPTGAVSVIAKFEADAQPPVQLAITHRSSTQEFMIELHGPRRARLLLESSGNLLDWNMLATPDLDVNGQAVVPWAAVPKAGASFVRARTRE